MLEVAVQMDPLEQINFAGDSTFALMLEAKRRGHRLWFYTPDQLSLEAGGVTARAQEIAVFDEPGALLRTRRDARARSLDDGRGAAAAGPALRSRLYHLDAFSRARRRARARRQRSRQRAQRAGKTLRDGVRRSDAADADHPRPRGDRALSRRAWRSRDEAAVRPWRRQRVQGRAARPEFRLAVRSVLDDLPRALGGAALPAGGRRRATSASCSSTASRSARSIACRRRTIFAPIWCAAARRRPTELSDREQEICARLGPELKKRGLLFVGIDVIDGWLTEINVTSPTGLRALKRIGGPDLAPPIMRRDRGRGSKCLRDGSEHDAS